MKIKGIYKTFNIIALVLIAVAFSASFFIGGLSLYERYMLAMTVGTFLLFGFDKTSAVLKGVRVPEAVFHLLTIAGGVFGGWIGMVIFRHKKNNIRIIGILVLASALHIALASQIYPEYFPQFGLFTQ